jgi:hypothetical protein
MLKRLIFSTAIAVVLFAAMATATLAHSGKFCGGTAISGGGYIVYFSPAYPGPIHTHITHRYLVSWYTYAVVNGC